MEVLETRITLQGRVALTVGESGNTRTEVVAFKIVDFECRYEVIF
jgi:hypothetical protein